MISATTATELADPIERYLRQHQLNPGSALADGRCSNAHDRRSVGSTSDPEHNITGLSISATKTFHAINRKRR